MERKSIISSPFRGSAILILTGRVVRSDEIFVVPTNSVIIGAGIYYTYKVTTQNHFCRSQKSELCLDRTTRTLASFRLLQVFVFTSVSGNFLPYMF